MRFQFLLLLLLGGLLNFASHCDAQTIIRRGPTQGTVNGTKIQIIPNNGVNSGGTIVTGNGTSVIGGLPGQTVYRLYDANNRFRETATVNNNQLQIMSGGVLYLYQRTRQYDTRQTYGFYNTTYDKIIRWPLSNVGQLRVAERALGGGYAFRDGFHIGPRYAPGPTRPSSRGQVVVIESALPGGGLVTARRGRGGSVEIGDANPNITRNQFYLQDISAGDFSLAKVANQQSIVSIADGRARDGANVQVWDRDDAETLSTRFRLRPAENGFYYIETKLRRGFVWTVDGNSARDESNIRLARQIGQANQMFRISRPEAVGGTETAGYDDEWGIFPDGGPGASKGNRRESRLVQIKLTNSQVFELWVLLVDRRDPQNPQRIKIPPKQAVTVKIQDGGGVSQLFHGLSVYRLQRQSVVIDRTRPGPGVVTDENFSPKSVGWFEIPFDMQNTGGTLDAYRRAVDSHNPGKVVRIDPAIWKSLDSVEGTTEGTETGQSVGRGGEMTDDDDGPFGVAPLPRPSYRRTELASHLILANTDRVTPAGALPLCLAKLGPDGSLSVEQIIWQTVTYVETKERVVNGRTVEVSEERTKNALHIWPHSLAPGEVELYLADGRRLDEVAARQVFQTEVPALILQEGWVSKLDEQFLALLQLNTPIIVSSVAPAGGGPPGPGRLQQRQLPTTPIRFCGVEQALQGGVNQLWPYSESVEQTYTVAVPVTEETEVDGKTVTTTREVLETRTHQVMITKENKQHLPENAFRLYEMSGKKLSATAVQRLATPQAAVFVAAGEVVDPWYRKVLRPETILLIERGR